MKRLKDHKVKVLFKGFLLNHNFHQRHEMIDLANKIEVLYSFDYNLIPMLDGATDNLAAGITTNQMKTMYQEVASDGLTLRNNVKLRSREDNLPRGGQVICNPGLVNGSIGSSGDVFPCPILRIPLGNLKERPFKEIWATDKIDSARHMTLDDLEHCPDCPILEYCNRCPGVAFLETGNYLGPAYESVCSKYKALVDVSKGSDAI
jgi:radical SAM protein with 4Fe4S-binding SPASM domain